MSKRYVAVVHLICKSSTNFSEQIFLRRNVLSVYFNLHKINKRPKKDVVSDVVHRLVKIWNKA